MFSRIGTSGLFSWMYLDSEVRSYRTAGKTFGLYSTRLGDELLLMIYFPELWSNLDDPNDTM